MISEVAKRMMDKIPADTRIFARKYAALVVRINHLLREKGYSSNGDLTPTGAKMPEIVKWVNGQQDFSLRTIAKLEAEIGEVLWEVPKQ